MTILPFPTPDAPAGDPLFDAQSMASLADHRADQVANRLLRDLVYDLQSGAISLGALDPWTIHVTHAAGCTLSAYAGCNCTRGIGLARSA